MLDYDLLTVILHLVEILMFDNRQKTFCIFLMCVFFNKSCFPYEPNGTRYSKLNGKDKEFKLNLNHD